MIARLMMALGMCACFFPGGAQADETVTLKPVQLKNEMGGFNQISLGESGEKAIPFGTKSGKLRLKVDVKSKKVFADVNDDGAIDAKDGDGIAVGQALTVPVMVSGQKVDYRLRILHLRKDMVFVAGLTQLSGTYKNQPITLEDTNVNGCFADVQFDRYKVGAESASSPLTDKISLEGGIWTWSMAPDKVQLTLKKYDGPTGKLLVKSTTHRWSGHMQLIKEDGTFAALAKAGERTLLLPGIYVVAEVVCSKTVNGSTIELDGETEKRIPIKVGDNALSFGAPFKLKMVAEKAKDNPRKLTIKDVQLVDSFGVTYSADASGGKSTLKSFLESGKTRKYMSNMEYG